MAEQNNELNAIRELYLVNYLIGFKTVTGEPILGGVGLKVSLIVNTADNSITGASVVSQATNPPLHISSQDIGEYHYQCTMKSCFIAVNVDGFAPYPGIPPVGVQTQQNLQLNMLLEDDWQSGVANFKYFSDGEWHTVNNAFVELTESSVTNDVAALAEIAKAKS